MAEFANRDWKSIMIKRYSSTVYIYTRAFKYPLNVLTLFPLFSPTFLLLLPFLFPFLFDRSSRNIVKSD